MADRSSQPIRRTVYFSGDVQGVGFRYTTRFVASRFDVSGFVRNLHDGRVELVAEGSPGELDRLQHAVCEAMGRHITALDASDAPATGEFDSFRVAF